MSILQTAERVSARDPSDNYVFQRSVLAYVESAKQMQGKILEIGTGSGYGIEIIAPVASHFTTIDKFKEPIVDELIAGKENITALQMSVPPLTGMADNTFDCVITFQVIEHIVNDREFVKEIHRVLKPGGKLFVTTPNIKMSITRNPWHVREYTVEQLRALLSTYFSKVQTNGVFGNEKVMTYYIENKKSVHKITRFDIFNLQYRLPRQILQIPYDILNRMNRKKLLNNNPDMVNRISMEDYYVAEANNDCFDLFYIAIK